MQRRLGSGLLLLVLLLVLLQAMLGSGQDTEDSGACVCGAATDAHVETYSPEQPQSNSPDDYALRHNQENLRGLG